MTVLSPPVITHSEAPIRAAFFDDGQLSVWIERMVTQDERALTLLYEATRHRVFGLVLRIVRSRALAEEVVEESYFQAWRQAVRFDPSKGKAITWIFNIAHSRAIDTVRRENKYACADFLSEEVEDFGDGTEGRADELLDIAWNHQRVREALQSLGAQPRQLVALAFFKGLTHDEISHHMTLPLGTVKAQIRRALATLKLALSDLAPGQQE